MNEQKRGLIHFGFKDYLCWIQPVLPYLFIALWVLIITPGPHMLHVIPRDICRDVFILLDKTEIKSEKRKSGKESWGILLE
jgi:hypothetical protein